MENTSSLDKWGEDEQVIAVGQKFQQTHRNSHTAQLIWMISRLYHTVNDTVSDFLVQRVKTMKKTIEEEDIWVLYDIWINMNWIKQILKWWWWWWWCILWVHENACYLRSCLVFIGVSDRSIKTREENTSEHHRRFESIRYTCTLCNSFQRAREYYFLSSLDGITLDSFTRDYIKVYQGLAASPQLEKPVK